MAILFSSSYCCFFSYIARCDFSLDINCLCTRENSSFSVFECPFNDFERRFNVFECRFNVVE